jgi:8-oxo-dGTP pyrophosphatase MutT (NUDIX family)
LPKKEIKTAEILYWSAPEIGSKMGRMLRDLSVEEIQERLRNAEAQQSAATVGSPIGNGGLFPYKQVSIFNSYPVNPSSRTPSAAAVLVPLLHQKDGWHLLFIRRSEIKEDVHSGQVAFPGGRSEGNETLEETALRESCEEIGLRSQDVRVLGSLTPMHTITNYIVTPVVGIIPHPYDFRLSPQEVSRIFTIPLNWLADPTHFEERLWSREPLHNLVRVIYFSPYDGEILWGLSARITLNFLAIYQQ